MQADSVVDDEMPHRWVRCQQQSCGKWRKVPRDFNPLHFFCNLNPDKERGECSVVQELSNEEIDKELGSHFSWIECADCNKWRRVSDGVIEEYRNQPWHCSDNDDKRFDKCAAPQEKSDQQIDEELQLDNEIEMPPNDPCKGDLFHGMMKVIIICPTLFFEIYSRFRDLQILLLASKRHCMHGIFARLLSRCCLVVAEEDIDTALTDLANRSHTSQQAREMLYSFLHRNPNRRRTKPLPAIDSYRLLLVLENHMKSASWIDPKTEEDFWTPQLEKGFKQFKGLSSTPHSMLMRVLTHVVCSRNNRGRAWWSLCGP